MCISRAEPAYCLASREGLEIQQTNIKVTQHIMATKWHLHAAFFIIGNCTDAVLYTVQTDHAVDHQIFQVTRHTYHPFGEKKHAKTTVHSA